MIRSLRLIFANIAAEQAREMSGIIPARDRHIAAGEPSLADVVLICIIAIFPSPCKIDSVDILIRPAIPVYSPK